MWLNEDKLKEKTAHFRLPSASQKRACLSNHVRGQDGELVGISILAYRLNRTRSQSSFAFPAKNMFTLEY